MKEKIVRLLTAPTTIIPADLNTKKLPQERRKKLMSLIAIGNQNDVEIETALASNYQFGKASASSCAQRWTRHNTCWIGLRDNHRIHLLIVRYEMLRGFTSAAKIQTKGVSSSAFTSPTGKNSLSAVPIPPQLVGGAIHNARSFVSVAVLLCTSCNQRVQLFRTPLLSTTSVIPYVDLNLLAIRLCAGKIILLEVVI